MITKNESGVSNTVKITIQKMKINVLSNFYEKFMSIFLSILAILYLYLPTLLTVHVLITSPDMPFILQVGCILSACGHFAIQTARLLFGFE